MNKKRPSYMLFRSSFGQGKKPLGLYIHVPFCEKKCAYCDFLSYDDKLPLEKRYVEAILRLIATYAQSMEGYEIDTVYFGGGTPTLLKKSSLKKILRAIQKKLPLKEGAEITVEANPASGVQRKLKALRRAGVNRVSIGVQSLGDADLKLLGRIHTAEEAKAAILGAKKAGIENLSADVIFSLPGQTKEGFTETLRGLIESGVEHISAYSLKLEPGTPLYDAREAFRFPSEEEDRALYELAVDLLKQNGYFRYEISNFAKPGYESRHNFKYWNLEEYLGLGPGAHSYYQNRRFSMVADLEDFLNRVEKGLPLASEDSELTPILPSERLGEYVMMRLRLEEGILEKDFHAIFQKEFSKLFGEKLLPLETGGFLEHQNGRYTLTEKGIHVCNSVLCELLELDDLR